MDIVRALAADRGVTCFVGAGGKKTSMYALARRLDRAVVTATVRIPIFDAKVAELVVTDRPDTSVEGRTRWPVGLVPDREDDRYLGYELATIDRLTRVTDAPILVKADGARAREFKAPGSHEPRLPASTDVVVPIASAHVVGKPLDDRVVHRVDRVSALTGLRPGEEITPTAVGRVLASPHGGHKDVPEGASVVPLINKVDDPALEAVGHDIAAVIHRHADVSHVVLATMRAPTPLVAVV